MRGINSTQLPLRLLALTGLLTGLLGGATPAAAADSDIVINEVHYHPSGDDHKQTEFLELHNHGASSISLDGWSLGSGVAADLSGVSIPAGDYAIVAPDDNTAASTYGVTPAATYSGGLSNGGETITLSNGSTVVDTVSYDDASPWPVAADGDGASLELTNPDADNSIAGNWFASDSSPTPAAANNQAPTAQLANVQASPQRPNAGQSIAVTADVAGSGPFTLTYRIGFENPITVPMSVNAGVASGVIPAQSAGELVRFRIDGPGDLSAPAADDSTQYLGVVVTKPGTTGNIPTFEWFIEDDDYQHMVDNPLDDSISAKAVLAIDGTVYDNVDVEIRGGNYGRARYPKQNFNFDLPSGHEIDAPDLFDYPVDEFALQAEWSDSYFGRAESSWWLFEQAGFPKVHSFSARVQRNGNFYGLYRVQEKLDGKWRDAVDFGDDAFYKADNGAFEGPDGFSKKAPKDDDKSEIHELNALLRRGQSSSKTNDLYTTFDVPAVINFMAAAGIVGHDDSKWHNFYMRQDADNLRWSIYPWDLDNTFHNGIFDCEGTHFTDLRCVDSNLFDSIYDVPEFEAMYWARVRTLLNEALNGPRIVELHNERIAAVGAVGGLEAREWDRSDPTSSSVVNRFRGYIDRRRNDFAGESNVPSALGAPSNIVISEMLVSPADGGAEFLELTNTGTRAVDLSGWHLDAVFKGDDVLPGGTILLPGASLVLTDSINDLVGRYPNLPNVIVIEYSGGLKGSGEELKLTAANGQNADVVDYQDAAPWPDQTAGTRSIELLDVDGNNNDGSSWNLSNTVGGTPGAAPASTGDGDTGDGDTGDGDTDDGDTDDGDTDNGGTNTINIVAQGTTGQEQATLVINGTTHATFTANTNLTTHTYTTNQPINTIRIRFTNDQSSPTDRNLYIDYITINNTRYQTEAPTTESIGTYTNTNGCSKGFKQSPWLHCNGYLDYKITPTTGTTDEDTNTDDGDTNTDDGETDDGDTNTDDSGTDDSGTDDSGTDDGDTDDSDTDDGGTNTINIVAQGTTGQEQATLVINGTTHATFTANTNLTTHTYTTNQPINTIRIRFTNDQSSPTDRNLYIDYITINNTRYQTEAPTTESIGTYTNTNGCSKGFKQSPWLHCNGYLDYKITPTTGTTDEDTNTDDGDTNTDDGETDDSDTDDGDTNTDDSGTDDSDTDGDSDTDNGGTNTINIVAQGTTGQEQATLVINGTTHATFTANTNLTTHTYTTNQPINTIRIRFTNDQSSPTDRNLYIDYITINNTRYQTEAPTTESIGTYTNTNGCSKGFKQSPWLHCNGYLDYKITPTTGTNSPQVFL